MDGGPFFTMAAAASVASDGITRSAFIAAARRFLQSPETQQPNLSQHVQSPRSSPSQLRCSSCRGRPGIFGAGLVLSRRQRGMRCNSSRGNRSDPLEQTSDALASRPITFGVRQLSCGVAALSVVSVGSLKIVGSLSKPPPGSSRRERDVDRELHPLEKLLAPLTGPGRFWTNVLLAANIAVFLGQLAVGSDRVVMWGAKINEFIARGDYWRFITANFLHAGVSHLLMNCYSLNNVGPSWERIAGGPRFVLVYAVASLTTVLASYKFNPQPSVGASGAIFGLVGALTVFSYRYMRLFRDGEGRQLFNSLLRTVALNALLGTAIQRWDNWGHAGGLLGGAAAAWFLGPAYEVNYYAGLMIDRPPLKKLHEWLEKKEKELRDKRKGSKGTS